MASLAPLRDVTSGLAAFRRRIRGLFLTHAVARIVLAVTVGLVLFFLADLLLDLPLGVRRFVRLGLLGSQALFPGAAVLAAGLGLLAVLLSRGGGPWPVGPGSWPPGWGDGWPGGPGAHLGRCCSGCPTSAWRWRWSAAIPT